MSQFLHHLRIVLADREVVQPGWIATAGRGRTVAGFPEFEPFEQTRSNDTVHLRTKLVMTKEGSYSPEPFSLSVALPNSEAKSK